MTASAGLRFSKEAKWTGVLDHLSCRYYRLYPQKGVSKVRVALEAHSRLPHNRRLPLLRGFMATVTPNMHRERSASLPLPGENKRKKGGGLPWNANLDHVVVAVCNTGNRVADPREHFGPDDGQEYTITASAS